MVSFLTPEYLLNLATLTGLEIVLGVDNIIYISLLVFHLPPKDRARARFIGIGIALVFRVLLLQCAAWVISLTEPFFHLGEYGVSGRDVLLLIGGGFLVFKSVKDLIEMVRHPQLEPATTASEAEGASQPVEQEDHRSEYKPFWKVISDIVFIDLVLSFDSIITAVGITEHRPIIVIAIMIAMAVMLLSAAPVGRFIQLYPSVRLIALLFILMIGAFLMLAGVGIDVPKGYLYGSMLYTIASETLNIWRQRNLAKCHPSSPPGDRA